MGSLEHRRWLGCWARAPQGWTQPQEVLDTCRWAPWALAGQGFGPPCSGYRGCVGLGVAGKGGKSGCRVLGRQVPASMPSQSCGCPAPQGHHLGSLSAMGVPAGTVPERSALPPQAPNPKSPSPHPQLLHPGALSSASTRTERCALNPRQALVPSPPSPAHKAGASSSEGTEQVRDTPPSGCGALGVLRGAPSAPLPLRPPAPCECQGRLGAVLTGEALGRRAAAGARCTLAGAGERQRGLFSISAAATGNSSAAAGGQRSPPEPIAGMGFALLPRDAALRPAAEPPRGWECSRWAGSCRPQPGLGLCPPGRALTQAGLVVLDPSRVPWAGFRGTRSPCGSSPGQQGKAPTLHHSQPGVQGVPGQPPAQRRCGDGQGPALLLAVEGRNSPGHVQCPGPITAHSAA